MKAQLLISMLIVTLIMFSCKSKKELTENPDNNRIENKDVVLVKTDIGIPIIDERKEPSKNVEIKRKAGFYSDMNSFSFSLFGELSKKSDSKNISFSPISLNIAMGMVYSGARQSTATQISNIFGFNESHDSFYPEFSEYYNHLKSFGTDTAFDFNLANRVYLEKTYQIRKDYKLVIEKYFDGAFEIVDFKKNFRTEEKNINSWVSEITKDRIKDLIPDNTLDTDTRMVLVNAIYIKSKWKYPFKESATREKDFFSSATDKTKTDFMVQRQNGIKYAYHNNCQILELEYTSNELSLIIILPQNSTADDLAKFIPDEKIYQEMLLNLRHKDVYVEIPKFKTESSFKFAKILEDMGLTDAFDTRANFSGITDNNDLAISEVIQKVFFEIDEKGSEAAAATAVIMYQTSSAYNPALDDYISFIANKPFIYILKENKFNTPLFIGQYMRP